MLRSNFTRLSLTVLATLGAAGANAQTFFTEQILATSVSIEHPPFPADVDGDGDIDVIQGASEMEWLERTATGYVKHDIAEQQTDTIHVDINSDGWIDILCLRQGRVLRYWVHDGTSSPTFMRTDIFAYPVGTSIFSHFPVDIDHDGDVDVACIASNPSSFDLFESDGAATPTFTRRTISTEAGLRWIRFSVDVDGDGDTDLLADQNDGTGVRAYLNDGAIPPSFVAVDLFETTGAMNGISAGDLNGDGHVDVVVKLGFSNATSGVEWYSHDGAMGFTLEAAYPDVTAAPVRTGDLDNDGDLDIFGTKKTDGTDTNVWFENGGGPSPTFTRQDIPSTIPLTFRQPIDYDCDGDVDFFTTGGGLRLLINHASATASPMNTTTFVSYNTLAEAVTDASTGDTIVSPDFDFQNEPTIDLAGKGISILALSELVQPVGGVYSLADQSRLGVRETRTLSIGAVTTVAACSNELVELNGAVDVPSNAAVEFQAMTVATGPLSSVTVGADATLDAGADTLASLKGDLTVASNASVSIIGDATLASNTRLDDSEIFGAAMVARSVAAGDMDGDGDTDVVSASQGDDSVRWYENDGSQNFTPHVITSAADAANSVEVADLDNDGDLDAISAAGADDAIRWYENDGATDPSFTTHDIFLGANGAITLHIADIDADGDIDVLSGTTVDRTVRWHENDGAANPQFATQTIFVGTVGLPSISTDDLNGDGDLDIVIASVSDPFIRLFLSDGAADPVFSMQPITTTAGAVRAIDTVDLDGDGDIDVVTGSASDDALRWYENDGAAAFTSREISLEVDNPSAVVTGDMDLDGDIDIFAAAQNDDLIIWFASDGAPDPQFEPNIVTFAADSVFDLFLADVDSDGDPDLLSASTADDTIRWYDEEIRSSFDFATGSQLAVGGTLTLDPTALFVAPGAAVHVGGDLGVQLADHASLDLATTDVRMTGVFGSQELETTSLDIGPDPAGLDRSLPGHFPLGSLTIASGAVVELVDVIDNASDGLPAADAIYTSELVLEAGATLNTNGLKVYYEFITLDGSVDTQSNLVSLGVACGPGDVTTNATSNGVPDGLITLSDFSYYLGLWATADPQADITAMSQCVIGSGGDGVDLSDFSCYLSEWAPGCP